MPNLIVSANIVLPLFIIMIVGYIAKRLHLFDDHSLSMMNNLVFRIFIPVLLFKNISTASLDATINWNVFIFIIVAVPLMFGLLFLFIPHMERVNKCRSVLIQGIGRSNFVIFGLTVTYALFPGANLGVPSLLVAIVVPIFNVMSVIALEVYRGGQIRVGVVVKSVIKNPLIIASILGIIALLIKIPMPDFFNTAVSDISIVGTPLALFLLGGSFEFSKVGENRTRLFIGVLGKLVIMPLIFVTAAVLCGFRGIELASLMVVFAAPTAVNSYTMAQQMGADDTLACQQVVLTTVFSIPSMFLWIFFLKQMAMI